MTATPIVPQVVSFPQSVPAVVIPDLDLIEGVPEERDDTAWQDFLIYCAEVRS